MLRHTLIVTLEGLRFLQMRLAGGPLPPPFPFEPERRDPFVRMLEQGGEVVAQ